MATGRAGRGRGSYAGRSAGGRSSARRTGLLLVLGGALTAVLLAPVGSVPFFWLPLFLGVTFLAAAVSAGPSRPLWAGGVVTTCFGLEVALTSNGTLTHVPTAPGQIAALAVGVLIAALLERAGYDIDLANVAATVVFIAACYYANDKGWASGAFGRPEVYGAVVGAYGLLDVLRA